MNNRDYVDLPSGYEKAFSIDLQHDKKLAIIINVAAILIMAVLMIIGWLIVPLTEYLDMEPGQLFTQVMIMAVGVVVYMVLHELVHGITMRGFSGVRPRYGFTGMYAYAGSDVYFCKPHYIIIALAPIVVWGIVLQVLLCTIVPRAWFWVVYFIQINNLSGAAGDLYVTWRFSKLPKDVLVQDIGISMTVFQKE